MAPALLPLDELEGVVHDVAGRPIRKPRQGRVFLSPLHHALGRVHMANLGPGLEAGHGGPAGVGKEVEHLNGPSGLPNQSGHPVPIGSLLRKQPRMLKARGPNQKAQRAIGDGPGFRNLLKHFPLTAAALAAVVMGVGLFPRLGPFRRPNHLRVRPAQEHLAPALQLLAAAHVQHGVILPFVGYKHARIDPSLVVRLDKAGVPHSIAKRPQRRLSPLVC